MVIETTAECRIPVYSVIWPDRESYRTENLFICHRVKYGKNAFIKYVFPYCTKLLVHVNKGNKCICKILFTL